MSNKKCTTFPFIVPINPVILLAFIVLKVPLMNILGLYLLYPFVISVLDTPFWYPFNSSVLLLPSPYMAVLLGLSLFNTSIPLGLYMYTLLYKPKLLGRQLESSLIHYTYSMPSWPCPSSYILFLVFPRIIPRNLLIYLF